jgi:hypothetical protein
MKVAYLLYPRFTALDVVGTFQVLAAAPGTRRVFVAARVGAVIDDTGLCALQAGAGLGDVASADVLVIPGSGCSCDPDPWGLHPAGIDLALTLLGLSHGPAVAQTVQLTSSTTPDLPTTPALRRRRPPTSASS